MKYVVLWNLLTKRQVPTEYYTRFFDADTFVLRRGRWRKKTFTKWRVLVIPEAELHNYALIEDSTTEHWVFKKSYSDMGLDYTDFVSGLYFNNMRR